MKRKRPTRWRRFQYWLGGVFHVWSLWLGDVHADWLIDYYGEDGHRYGATRTCGYRMARIAARELHGTVIGELRGIVPAGGDDDIGVLTPRA